MQYFIKGFATDVWWERVFFLNAFDAFLRNYFRWNLTSWDKVHYENYVFCFGNEKNLKKCLFSKIWKQKWSPKDLFQLCFVVQSHSTELLKAPQQHRYSEGVVNQARARVFPRREGWLSLWIKLTWKVIWVRGKSLSEMALLPLERWKEWGQQLPQYPSTPTIPCSEERWALQICNFTRQRRDNKTPWLPITHRSSLQIPTFLMHKASGVEDSWACLESVLNNRNTLKLSQGRSVLSYPLYSPHIFHIWQ